MPGYESVIVEEDQDVVTITVNRPEALNALSSQVVAELSDVLASLGPPRRARPPGAAVLTGAGSRAFVAGADIREMSQMTTAEAKAFSDAGHRLAHSVEEAPFPVIAAVGGYALGGGCELALCCDFIYASTEARFGQPEIRLGIMPGFGGTQRLCRRVGAAVARELIYTGAQISADEALRIGLVNRVLPADELLTTAQRTAHEIAEKGALAVASCKRVIARGADADEHIANELEATAFSALFGTRDQREGMSAFLDKRQATFEGR